MSAAWIIYFAGVSADFKNLLNGIIVLGFVWLFAHIPMSDFRESKDIVKSVVVTLIAMFFVGVMSAIIPSQNTIYLMAGAKVTEDIVKSPEAKEIGGKILKVINQKLDEQVKK